MKMARTQLRLLYADSEPDEVADRGAEAVDTAATGATEAIEAPGETDRVEVAPEIGIATSMEAGLEAEAEVEAAIVTATVIETETAMTEEGLATGRSPVADMVVAEIETEIAIVIVTEGKAGHAGTASSLSY